MATNTVRSTTRKRPADFTGIQKQKLETEHAEELRLREAEIALVNAKAAEAREEVVDVDDGYEPIQEVAVAPAQVREPKVTIRVNYPIEDMTFGRKVFMPGDEDHPLGPDYPEPYVGPMRTYSFEEGKSYRVDRELAEHLDSKGYLWH